MVRTLLLLQRALVQFLVGELRSHMLHGAAPHHPPKKKKDRVNKPKSTESSPKSNPKLSQRLHTELQVWAVVLRSGILDPESLLSRVCAPGEGRGQGSDWSQFAMETVFK